MGELMSECKHEWHEKGSYNEVGLFFRDECALCGRIGMLSLVPDEKGIYKIVAKPMASVSNLNDFRKRKEGENVKTTKNS